MTTGTGCSIAAVHTFRIEQSLRGPCAMCSLHVSRSQAQRATVSKVDAVINVVRSPATLSSSGDHMTHALPNDVCIHALLVTVNAKYSAVNRWSELAKQGWWVLTGDVSLGHSSQSVLVAQH